MPTLDAVARYHFNRRRAALRELLRSEFGARRYQIRADQTVHAYGQMPNTNQTGWYLLGSIAEVEQAFNL